LIKKVIFLFIITRYFHAFSSVRNFSYIRKLNLILI